MNRREIEMRDLLVILILRLFFSNSLNKNLTNI